MALSHLEKHGHEADKTPCGKCRICSKRSYKSWAKKNRAHINEQMRLYRAANPERFRENERQRRETPGRRERHLETARLWREANPDKVRGYDSKRDKDLRRRQKLANRHANIERERARERARPDNLARNRKWRATHPGYNYANVKKWNEAHPEKRREYHRKRRARRHGLTKHHTASDVMSQLEAQRGRCYWCGKATRKAYHVDHVIPLSKGGSDGRENIVIACPFCNMSKKDKMPEEFAGRFL